MYLLPSRALMAEMVSFLFDAIGSALVDSFYVFVALYGVCQGIGTHELREPPPYFRNQPAVSSPSRYIADNFVSAEEKCIFVFSLTVDHCAVFGIPSLIACQKPNCRKHTFLQCYRETLIRTLWLRLTSKWTNTCCCVLGAHTSSHKWEQALCDVLFWKSALTPLLLFIFGRQSLNLLMIAI